jgi:hypothetical protein
MSEALRKLGVLDLANYLSRKAKSGVPPAVTEATDSEIEQVTEYKVRREGSTAIVVFNVYSTP